MPGVASTTHQVVGRLAPSPTGGLHLGHARTFFLAWLAARQEQGRVLLRVEDIDASRVRPEAAQTAIDDLQWLGLDWDEGPDLGGPSGPYVQSQRLDRYRHAIERLLAQDRIYPCTCTRADIARAASAPHNEEEGVAYPGTCAGKSRESLVQELGSRPHAWRFRVPRGDVFWNDLAAGPVRLDPSRHGGDFVLGRAEDAPSYQLAVVVDDAAMGVTQVIRGADLISSTPRQLVLYQALGLTPPEFGHVPLVHGEDGRRLAKRDQSIKLATLRNEGVDPRRLVGLIARSCGLASQLEPSLPRDWLGKLDWQSLPPEPWVVTHEELAALG